MKRYVIPFVLVSLFLAACPSPVLKWIETSADSSGPARLSRQGDAKEIVSFSFGIDGETDFPIGTAADISGKIPILVILPEGTGLGNLAPQVTYIGKSLTPPSGEPGNFSSPAAYTVTAENGTTRDYIVRVYEKGASTKEIIRFTLDIFRDGGSPLGAEGIINQDTGDITITVVAGTALTALTAHITHTGAGVTGPLGRYHPDETFSFYGDFSNPTAWTVYARDESTKTYIVRVIWEKDDAKEITAFSLGQPGETDIIGAEPRSDGVYPILALVPDGPALTSNIPLIRYKGAAISPDDRALNFETPERYTVVAEDGTTRDYEVQVIRQHKDGDKLITGFYFQNPLVEGVIDQIGHTITLTVPAGTNLSALRPEVYYKGVSVSPMGGQPRNFSNAAATPVVYTVTDSFGGKQAYNVYVFTDPSLPPAVDAPGGGKVDVGVGTDGKPLVFVEFPTYISNPVINISYPGGNTYNYYEYTSIINANMTVIAIIPPAAPPAPPAPDTAQIDAFYFTDPPAIGTITPTSSGGNIAVTVPFGTDLRNLTATVFYTGKEIAGHPGVSPVKDAASFTSPVSYTVNASDPAVPSKTYTVNVRAAPNTAKEITGLSFRELNPVNTNVVISALPNAVGKYPIDVTVPSTSLPIGNLTPTISHTGDSITGPGVSGGAGAVTGSSTSFTSPVEYTVRAASAAPDGNITKTYVVTVHGPNPATDTPEILVFYFNNPLAVGLVNQTADTITVTVPPGTNTKALTPTLYFNGVSVRPSSGTTSNFDSSVPYTVTGSTGITRSYLVTVTAAPSSTKDITAFKFPAAPAAETVIGAVPDPDGTYPLAVWVPAGTSLGGLAPVITHTGAGVSPASGNAANFNIPQTYTVTAEDGSAKTYRVTVSTQDANAKIVTSFVFNEVPLGSSPSYSGYVRAVGSIDQGSHTITVSVPSIADVTGLTPTLTYIGRSISGPGESGQTANPFTGASQDFGTPGKTYIVQDQGGSTQAYTVTVIRQSQVDVAFTGEGEQTFVTNAFDPATGIVTVEIASGSGVTGPYEWYVDGVKQSSTGARFTLNVGNGYTLGRHEIMVSGMMGGLHYTARAAFTVSQ
jgi:hypothetical protein